MKQYTRRRQRGRPLTGVINWTSPQADGLLEVLDGQQSQYSLGHRTALTTNGSFDGFLARPDPLPGGYAQFSQAGGNNGYIQVAPSGGFKTNTDAFTLSVWLYESQAAAAGRSCMQLGSDAQWSLCLLNGAVTTGAFRASVVTTSGGPTQFNTTESAVMPAFVWNHVAMVWNPGSGLFLYVNGLLAGSNATATTTMRDVSLFKIGSGNGLSGNNWDGSVGDGRIYGRALSAAEVYAMYDPHTRWDLYASPATRVFFDVGSAAPAFTPPQPIIISQAVNRASTY